MKKRIINRLVIVILFFLVTYIFCYMTILRKNLMLSSATDWVLQHIQFADYFRKLFYSEKVLIPQFSFNLGSGQNIFNLAYYGIMNPLIIFSYFLPQIPIYIYMGYLGFSIIMFTGIFTYVWLYRNGYSKINSLISGLYIMFGCGFVLQSFNNYMFVSYLPFLIITFIGIDLYFERKIKSLFIIGSSLCIFISYVFAPAYSIAIVVYGIYKYLSVNKKVTFKNFSFSGLKFGGMYIVAILLTFIMLLPTALATFQGRVPNSGYSILKTLRPRIELQSIIYTANGPGLTAVVLFLVFINLFNKKNKLIAMISWFLFLGMSSSFFRVFLNGFMYDSAKMLLPYMLFYALLFAYTFDNIKAYSMKEIIITLFIMCIIILSLTNIVDKYIVVDVLTTIIIIFMLYKFKNKLMKCVPILFIVLIFFNTSKLVEKYPINKTVYPSIMGIKSSDPMVEDILKKDKKVYRINNFVGNTFTVNKIQNKDVFTTNYYSSLINMNCKNFYSSVMNIPHKSLTNTILTTQNDIMFYTYMGIKYITSLKGMDQPIGYKKVDEKNNIGLYKNENTFPLGYSINKTYNYDAFNKMDYPQKQETLLKYVITNDSKKLNINSDLEKVDFLGKIVSNNRYEYVDIKKQNNSLDIDVTKNDVLTYKLDKKIKDKILFINFNIIGDIPSDARLGITINGIKNSLSSPKYKYYNNNKFFQYVLSSNKPIDKLYIQLDKGNYKIRNLRGHTLDYSVVKSANKNIDKFNINRESITSRGLNGNINVKKDGWFVLTIPYDKGFTMKVDGTTVSYEKVNGGLMGFKIKKGYHNIELNYIAPGFRIGQVVSSIALLAFIIMFINDLCIIRKRKA